jgi:cytochrome P450
VVLKLSIPVGEPVGPLVERVREGARARVHWGLAHGFPRTVLRSAARHGDLQGRLVVAGGTEGDDLWDVIEEVRAAGPLHRSRLAYMTADHATVREVLTSNDFHSGVPQRTTGLIGRWATRTTPDVVHPIEPPSLLVTDPPDHTRYRKLVSRVFTVRAVENLRDRTQQIATGLLDRIPADEPVDLIAAYCSLLPVTVIAEILGVPEADRDRVLAFGTAAAPSLDLGLDWATYRRVDAGLHSFDAWLTRHIERLRREPGDNLLSQLVAAHDEDGTLSETELKSTAGLVLAAGFETTVNLLGNGIRLLHDHPDQRRLLDEDPGLWPNAVEEVLRLDPPVLLTGRFAERDTEVAGRTVRAGAMVTTILAGANRDPQVFTDPTRFDITRENAREHISFSAGRHYCLGASLARMEGEVGLRTLLERFPDLQLLPGARRRTTRILRGFETLPARLS